MKKHLKRLRVPAFWKVAKKHAKWVTKSRPGPHKKFESIPLLVIVRDILGLADKGKEAKAIIKMGEVLVDGKYRKDHKYPVGLMDVVSIPKLKSNYRIVPTYKGLELIEIASSESNKKICRVENKCSVKKRKIKGEKESKMQLNLHDSRNILLSASEAKKYKVGDSLLIELPSQKIIEHLSLEKGVIVIVTKGKNIGMVGKVENIIETKTKEPTKIICDVNGEKVEVIKDYVLVVGKDKPVIKVSKE